jgi:protein-tyrosine kinase
MSMDVEFQNKRANSEHGAIKLEHIQQALDKYRKSKQPEAKVATQKTKKFPDEQAIVYAKTKVHAANQEVLKERRVVSMLKHDPVAEVFRMLRTKVLKQLRENNWNSFAITAPTQGAGKSMIAANLAIAMSMEVNQTVLLVDLDLRFPKIHWYFDLQVEQGLSDYLTSDIPLSDILVNPEGYWLSGIKNLENDIPLSDILVNPGFERLVLLPGKGQVTGSSELLSGPRMKSLINDIKNHYESRIIIFDLPPVLVTDDVLVSMDYFDAALLVVEEGGNTPEEVTKALRMLSGTQLLGTVLNKSETMPDHQGYY